MPLPPLAPKQGLVLPAFIILVLYFTYNRFFREKRPYPFPPGPPGWFFIGNAGQLSVDHPERDYMRWGKEYGRFSVGFGWVFSNYKASPASEDG